MSLRFYLIVSFVTIVNLWLYVGGRNSNELIKSCICETLNDNVGTLRSVSKSTTSARSSSSSLSLEKDEPGLVDEEPQYVNRIIEVQRRLLFSCNEKVATLEVSFISFLKKCDSIRFRFVSFCFVD